MWRSYVIGLGFLVVYLLATFRYLAPVVQYQLDYAYISEVLCLNRDKPELECHGKCQLRKNMARLGQPAQQKEAMQHLIAAYQPVEDVPHALVLFPAFFATAASAPPAMPVPGIPTAVLPSPFHPPRQA
ncbi:hypothetical protein [Pontibacter litorisediminis]|uniref:hypothetical protein n=1 Tax=Pontibacter litorisediminis TaxID=1846260 RepID=UPI0023EE173A|nr:hypothetical protein [Pontibacter litorisediminis]